MVNKLITQHRDMRFHTNVSKSLRRISLVQNTWRQARCLIQLLFGICCMPHQTCKCGTKPFFLVGPGAGPEPTHTWHGQKYLRPVSISLIRGASGSKYQAVNTSGEGSLRLEEISSWWDTLGQVCAAASTAGWSTSQQLEWHSVNTAAALAPPA